MWQLELFTKRNTLQIVHSVSGKVVLKHLKQLFPLPERQNIRRGKVHSQEVKVLSLFFTHQSTPTMAPLTVFDTSFIPLPPHFLL